MLYWVLAKDACEEKDLTRLFLSNGLETIENALKKNNENGGKQLTRVVEMKNNNNSPNKLATCFLEKYPELLFVGGISYNPETPKHRRLQQMLFENTSPDYLLSCLGNYFWGRHR